MYPIYDLLTYILIKKEIKMIMQDNFKQKTIDKLKKEINLFLFHLL